MLNLKKETPFHQNYISFDSSFSTISFYQMYKVSVTVLLVLLSSLGFSQKLEVKNLECESRTNPLGIESLSPRLSWELQSEQHNVIQTAYRILVADNPESLQKSSGNIWDSKKVSSDASIQVAFAGKKLQPAKTYYWKVKVWDNSAKSSAWSKIATFTTGLYNVNNWNNAKWIGYEDMPDSLRVPQGTYAPAKSLGNKALQRPVVPLFRKEFNVSKKVSSAIAFISGLGQYEMNINGKKVGNSFLAPGWTDYEKRCLYNSYDITDLVNNGQNAIGVIVGNGFYNINRERYYKVAIAFGMPKMICRIKLTFVDGTTSDIVSDATWKTAPSPITFASIYGGEDYDAQLEQQGWDTPKFSDTDWKYALLVKPPKGQLQAEISYPVTVKDVFNARTVMHPEPNNYVYDFGQNASAIIEVKVKGKKGQTIKLIPAELLNDKKLANQNATGKPYYFSYTLKGDGIETWRPRFTYYGFRFVQVVNAVPDTAINANDLPKIIGLQSLHTSTSASEAGTFECSNELFNKTNTLIKWAIQSNVQSVITDCPHREKLSWLEQDHLVGSSIHYNLDIYHLFCKLVYDMMDAQTENGLVPNTAPEYLVFDDEFGRKWGFGYRDSPEWGSSSIILPWLIYKWYGDKNMMREAFPMMKKYIAYLGSKADNHIITHGLGDWYDNGPKRPGFSQLTPNGITATAIYYYDLNILSKMAAMLNDHKEAERLAQLAKGVKKAFNEKFFNEETKLYASGSQTAMAMPLSLGLVNDEDKPAVFKNLVDSIIYSGKKITAGDVGFHFLVQALTEGGASQLLYDMNSRDDVPGYGYQLKKGATALTESWQALEVVSNNHLMLGHIMEWFYSGLAGIRQSDSSVAYKEIIIDPQVVGDLTFVKGSFQTPYGMISSEWNKKDGAFSLNVKVPANTTAIVYLPAFTQNKITANDLPLNKVKGAKFIGYKDRKAIVKIGSGNYQFEVSGEYQYVVH